MEIITKKKLIKTFVPAWRDAWQNSRGKWYSKYHEDLYHIMLEKDLKQKKKYMI